MNPVILGAVAILAAFTTALASADNMLRGHSWLVPYLYGACGVLLLIAAINAFAISHREKRTSITAPPITAPQIHQENKQTQTFNPTLNVSYAGVQQPPNAGQVLMEKTILEFMKGRPHGYYEIEQIAGHVQMTNRQTWDLLEELEKKGRVHRGKADVKGGAIWTISDLEL